MSEKLLTLLPIAPPLLEYEDGVITENSAKSLEQTIGFYNNYAHVYLSKLLHMSYEDACVYVDKIDWNRLQFEESDDN